MSFGFTIHNKYEFNHNYVMATCDGSSDSRFISNVILMSGHEVTIPAFYICHRCIIYSVWFDFDETKKKQAEPNHEKSFHGKIADLNRMRNENIFHAKVNSHLCHSHSFPSREKHDFFCSFLVVVSRLHSFVCHSTVLWHARTPTNITSLCATGDRRTVALGTLLPWLREEHITLFIVHYR